MFLLIVGPFKKPFGLICDHDDTDIDDDHYGMHDDNDDEDDDDDDDNDDND